MGGTDDKSFLARRISVWRQSHPRLHAPREEPALEGVAVVLEEGAARIIGEVLGVLPTQGLAVSGAGQVVVYANRAAVVCVVDAGAGQV